MDKSYASIKVGSSEIEIQALSKTVVLTLNGKSVDLPIAEAEELYSKLGELLGTSAYYVDGPTH